MKNKYAAFYTELKKLPGMSKDEAVYEFTNGRTRSLRDLSEWDVQELTRRLRSIAPRPPLPASRTSANGSGERDLRAPMIKKVVAMAHEMGMVSKMLNAKGQMQNDYSRLNRWMLEKSYLKKKLNAYTYAELPKLVSQMENVYRDFLKKI